MGVKTVKAIKKQQIPIKYKKEEEYLKMSGFKQLKP